MGSIKFRIGFIFVVTQRLLEWLDVSEPCREGDHSRHDWGFAEHVET